MANMGFFEPYLKNMDLICGLIGIILGLTIAVLSVFGIINQILIGLTILCISSLYILIRPRIRSQREIDPISISPRLLSVLNIVFWSFLSVTLLIWYFNLYYRPTSYFILISILSAIIAIEIFSSRDSHRFWPIFVKIVILSLVIRGGIYFNYPSIMGYDAYFHTKLADLIMLTGSVPPFEISDQYVYAPIVHTFIASMGLLCQIPVKYAVFLSIGVGSVISTLFLYIIGKNIAGPQIGLLAVLLANLTNDLIVRGITNITADSLVVCYLLVMLYLVFADTIHLNTRDSLLIFFSLLLVITHQLSTFVVFLILFVLIFIQVVISYIYSTHFQKSRSIIYLTLFGIAITSYWIGMEFPGGSTFFDYVLGPFIDVLRAGGEYGSDFLVVGRSYEQPLSDRLILQSSYLILPFFAIGGLLLWMTPESRKRFYIAVVAAALFVMVYGIPLLGIRNLLTSRWMPLLCIFLAILAAAFIWRSVNLMSSKAVRICSIFLIVFVFAFLMITTPGINKDNPLVSKDTTVRNQFTLSEIQAAKTLGSVVKEDTFVDPGFSTAYIIYGDPKSSSERDQLPNEVQSYDIYSDSSISANSLFVLRTCTLYEPVHVKASDLYGDMTAQVIPQRFFDKFRSSYYQQIYDSSYVLGYLSR
ncbi:MAG: hypothetical protein LLF90_07205 [Methanomicrobiaceae archaeon]|nr:hypothetical protein [Methanomicrobiaceae archaeon]